MVLGLSLSTFTVLHVVISLIGIASGALVLKDMLRSRLALGLTAVFLVTTVATSVTGFFFPSTRLGLGHAIGGMSLIVLVPTLMALYQYRLAGPWRSIYVAGATAALYLNVVIGVWQAFGKIAFLRPLAPSLSAPPLVGTQLVVLAIFVALGALAVKRFLPRARPYCATPIGVHTLV
ncbi:MAG: hypothetical protein EXR12_01410 [Rhodospirillaceae bacterium]|nr:hypothetical protein [Rhodospirillaceae bacterium]